MFGNHWVPKFLRLNDSNVLLQLDLEELHFDQIKNYTIEHIVNHVSKLK